MSSFAKVMTFGTGNGWFGAGAVMGLMGCVGAFCHLLNKKKYKDSDDAQFEKIDLSSISTGPSIYDSTWSN